MKLPHQLFPVAVYEMDGIVHAVDMRTATEDPGTLEEFRFTYQGTDPQVRELGAGYETLSDSIDASRVPLVVSRIFELETVVNVRRAMSATRRTLTHIPIETCDPNTL